MDAAHIPLSWERLLWRGRPWPLPLTWPGARPASYLLTDFRLVRIVGERSDEVVLHDITDIRSSQSRVERLLGVSTLTVHTRRHALVLRGVRRGAQFAALLELLSDESSSARAFDAESVQAALDWEPRTSRRRYGEATVSVMVVAMAVIAAIVGFHGHGTALAFAPDDPIVYATGDKRPQADIVRFMERDVMPWARVTFGPLKGGPDRVTCQTCHGPNAVARGWRMPAVAALPQPDLRGQGWELYGGVMDAQIRNAIYGYLAESDKQARAGYMRETVMPGMAQLLHRPPYDFTQPYDYNRSRQAFGCYHCHQVK